MMTNPTILTFVSVFLVSIVSLVGIFLLFFNKVKVAKINYILVSLAAGTLLGNSFFHLFPESLEALGNYESVALLVLSGIMAFFVLEKILNWRHEHNPEHEHPVGYMNIVADGFHNLLDGVLIASAFSIDIALGVSTTIAVILHEIPQEIGDFGILMNAKFSKKKALGLNFLSAAMAFLGAAIALTLQDRISHFSDYMIAVLSGAFIYIAVADLIPEMHKQQKLKKSLIELTAMVLGIALMFLIRE